MGITAQTVERQLQCVGSRGVPVTATQCLLQALSFTVSFWKQRGATVLSVRVDWDEKVRMNYNKYQLLSLQTSINKHAFHVVLFINKRSPCRWWGPRRLRPFTRTDRKVGQQDGSADKSTWCLTWQPRTQDGAGHTPEVALWPSRVCGGTHTHSQRHYIILLKMSRRKIFRLL